MLSWRLCKMRWREGSWNLEKLHWDGESGATSPKPPFFYLLRHKVPIWTVWGLLGGLEPKHANPTISLHRPNFTPFHCTCQMLPVMNTSNRPDCKSVICPERYEREGGWLKVWWSNKSIITIVQDWLCDDSRNESSELVNSTSVIDTSLHFLTSNYIRE